jgi:hypothetical protein
MKDMRSEKHQHLHMTFVNKQRSADTLKHQYGKKLPDCRFSLPEKEERNRADRP